MFATKLKEHDEKLIKQGIKKRTIKTDRRMLEKKYSIDDISDVAGLTHEEIEQLR